MLDLLRDPFWQFVGAVLPVLVIVIQMRRKGLSYHILEDSKIVDIDPAILPRVDVRFDGRRVGCIRRLQIRLINVGNLPIRSADYEGPITLEFCRDAQVLKAEIGEARPKHLQAKVTIAKNCIVFRPLLLQRGEYVTLNVLVSSNDGRMRIFARILGINEITDYLTSASYGWYGRRLQSREFRELLKAWSIFPLLFGLMGAVGMIHVRHAEGILLWLGFSAAWYSLLGLLVALALVAVPLVVRPLKRSARISFGTRV